MSFRFRLSALLPFALAACAGERQVTEPLRATSVEVTTLDQVATAGLTVPVAPTFVVRDQHGQPLAGVRVAIVVTAGGGTLADAPVASATAATSVGTWTVGQKTGANELTITAGGLAPVTVRATANAGAPARLVVAHGTDSATYAGATLVNLSLAVQDQFGNGVAGQTVSFDVSAGGGSLQTSSAVSDANGMVGVPVWTLGRSATPQLLHATLGGLAADIPATVATSYGIDVSFFGDGMTETQKALFTDAATRLAGLVIGDLESVVVTEPVDFESLCGMPGLPRAFLGTIDDMVIFAAVSPIDGAGGSAGNILGQAYTCATRSSDGMPVVGVMQFDSYDVDRMMLGGQMPSIILHEMLHTLGVGTLWASRGLVVSPGTANVGYAGRFGIYACGQVGGGPYCTGAVPVENFGGVGTVGVHWRESTFDAELMTGYAEPGGVTMPLSLITAGSLADLGYTVNPLSADPYRAPSILARLAPQPRAEWERVIDGGVIQLNRRGGVRVVRRPGQPRSE